MLFFEGLFEFSWVDRVEGLGANRLPVSCLVLDPALGFLGAAGLVELFALGEEEDVLAGVFLLRGDEAQGAVPMVVVVPLDDLVGPLLRFP